MANPLTESLKSRRYIWQVWSKDGPSGAVKRAILQVLYDFLQSSKEGRVFPSETTIAEKVGIDQRHVRRHTAELEADGWLRRSIRESRSGQGWKRYQYELTFPARLNPDHDQWLAEVEERRKAALNEHREAQGWEPVPDPAPAQRPAPETIPHGVEAVAWREWCAHYRRWKGREMSEAAAKNCAARLRSVPRERQLDCVQFTAENGYLQPANSLFKSRGEPAAEPETADSEETALTGEWLPAEAVEAPSRSASAPDPAPAPATETEVVNAPSRSEVSAPGGVDALAWHELVTNLDASAAREIAADLSGLPISRQYAAARDEIARRRRY